MGYRTQKNAESVSRILNEAGFDESRRDGFVFKGIHFEHDCRSPKSLVRFQMLVNAAGVSPSQAPIETILRVDLWNGPLAGRSWQGNRVRRCRGSSPVSRDTVCRLSLRRGRAARHHSRLTRCLHWICCNRTASATPLHAYQMVKRCNEKRVMAEAVKWGERGARVNSISPGIIVTPLAIDEFNGPRGEFYKNMFAKCPAGRPGTADEVANVAELLMSGRGRLSRAPIFSSTEGPPRPISTES